MHRKFKRSIKIIGYREQKDRLIDASILNRPSLGRMDIVMDYHALCYWVRISEGWVGFKTIGKGVKDRSGDFTTSSWVFFIVYARFYNIQFQLGLVLGSVMFSSNCNQFPEVKDGKIELIPFLEASREIVKFVDILGSVFIPIRNDINGNIEKLYKMHSTDKDKFSTLNDLVEYELRANLKQISIDALLWLKRALEYVNVFLTCFVEDNRQKKCTENLSPFFHTAYEEKLKPYHGWLVQKLFGLIVNAAPSRKSLMLLLAGDSENQTASEDIVLSNIETFITGLGSNIDAIHALYEYHNLHFNDKV